MTASRVFLSHTSELDSYPTDRSFVQAAKDAIAAAGMVPVDMSYFTAHGGNPADYCRGRIQECGAFVAIIGFRYGSIVAGATLSFTEMEFQEATRANLPRLIFLLADSDGLRAELVDTDRTVIDRFRQRLMDQDLIVSSFTNADRLEHKIFQALQQLPPRRRIVRSRSRWVAAVTVLAAIAAIALIASMTPGPFGRADTGQTLTLPPDEACGRTEVDLDTGQVRTLRPAVSGFGIDLDLSYDACRRGLTFPPGGTVSVGHSRSARPTRQQCHADARGDLLANPEPISSVRVGSVFCAVTSKNAVALLTVTKLVGGHNGLPVITMTLSSWPPEPS